MDAVHKIPGLGGMVADGWNDKISGNPGNTKTNHPGEASRSAVVDLTKGKYTVIGNTINGGNL